MSAKFSHLLTQKLRYLQNMEQFEIIEIDEMPEDLKPFNKRSRATGFANVTEDFVKGQLSLKQLLVMNPLATFALRIIGTAMAEAFISTDDIILVDRSIVAEKPDSLQNKKVLAKVDGFVTVS